MYGGIEVDMLSLGNADCILVSFWNGFSVYRVLIDGGNKGDAAIVRGFLRNQKIDWIDDLLSTHHHDDHSGGLVGLLADETLKFGKVAVNRPAQHRADDPPTYDDHQDGRKNRPTGTSCHMSTSSPGTSGR